MNDTTAQIYWLIAEDSQDDVLLLKRCCARLKPSPQLTVFQNGDQARDFLSEVGQRPDSSAAFPSLILSDLHMPNLDGFGLLAWVKGQVGLINIPFVLLTSSPDDGDKSKAKMLGADEYLVKPVTACDLLALLAGVLDRWCLRGSSAGSA